jgi:hypothetical protein
MTANLAQSVTTNLVDVFPPARLQVRLNNKFGWYGPREAQLKEELETAKKLGTTLYTLEKDIR